MASKQITRTLVADGERVHFEKSEGKLSRARGTTPGLRRRSAAT